MSTYSEYFAFDPKTYHPEINPQSRLADRWQNTFPHETFIALLRRLERMLARGSNIDKHSIWIQGAYGTGKSRIAWTLSSILTCPPDELEDYFNTYLDLRGETDLLNKLLGHKTGKIVVAERYKSDNIASPEDLVAAVYESLTDALDQAGCEYAAGGTLKGGILKSLEDADARKYFDSLIQRTPWCHEGCFAGKTADNVVAALKGSGETDALVRGILKIAKAEGFPKVRVGVEDLQSWIKETIARNRLKSLILVWDEFSSFFKNNKTRLDSLQALVELQDAVPFNLVIVTHFSGSIFKDGDQSAQIVIDRFKPQTEIKMPESIAFKLIGHVLKVKDALLESWDAYAGDLNSQMEGARKKVAGYLKGVGSEDFKKMLPFHPYAALALKNIAQLFDSNQRSMFNFIVDETEGLNAFQWFIKKHTPEIGEILSVDMLWDYFYETGLGASGATGRSNLDQQVAAILDVFPEHAGKMTTEDQRVLKTVLIFQALAKKIGNVPEFLATEENLRSVFEGIDDLEDNRGVNLCKAMVKSGILFEDEINGKKVFQAPMRVGGRDGEEIEKLKKNILEQTKTKDLLSGTGIDEFLSLPPALKTMRYDIRLAAPETFKTVFGQLVNEDSHGYKMKAILVVEKSSDDAYMARTCIANALCDPRAGSIAFIDASGTNMPAEDFDRWAFAKAKANYYATKDRQQSNNALNDAESIRRDWIEKVRDGMFRFHAPKDTSGVMCQRGEDVVGYLKTEVTKAFPLVFDFDQGLSEACFKAANKTSVTMSVLGGREHLPPHTACVIGEKQENALLSGAKNVEEYWKKNPDKSLSKLKRKIDGMVDRAFAPGAEGKIAIGEIVDALVKQGFTPSNLSAFLTGWILKEYAGGDYRYSDGASGGVMSAPKLSEMISNYFGKLNGTNPRYRDEFIERLTEEQRKFVEWSKEVFGLQESSSIEIVASQIIGRVKEFQYPLWCFDVMQEAVGLEPFVEKFTAILNPNNAKGANSGALATEIGRLALADSHKKEALIRLFTKENAEKAMRLWLEEFENGELMNLAGEIHSHDLLSDVRRCFDTEHVWLYDQGRGREEIGKVLRDYKIVAECIRRGFITAADSFSNCLDAWKDKAKAIRIPYETLITVRKDLKDFLGLLRDVARGGRLEESFKRDNFLNEVISRGDLIRDFFDNVVYTFRDIYKVQLDGLDQNEQEDLYKVRLDTSSFVMDKTTYEGLLHQKIEDIKQNQARTKLVQLWKNSTGTESPREWSMKFGTPILLLVPDETFEDAKRAFEAVNSKNSPSMEVKAAEEILEKRTEIFASISDGSGADEVFRKRALGKYAVVLNDIEAVRAKLRSIVGADVYAWQGSPKVDETIRSLASSEYQTKSAKSLGAKIDGMTAEEAKALLKELVMNQFEVGIELLSEE